MQKEEEVSVTPAVFGGGMGGDSAPLMCVCVCFSSRNYAVPDPPGLFDGHVWPMYVKHTKIMEDSGVDVGKCRILKSIIHIFM